MASKRKAGESSDDASKKPKGDLVAEVSGESILGILGSLMKHVKQLQNNHPVLIPKEDLAVNEIIEFLKPVSEPNGPLVVKRCCYVPGRSNLIVTYPAPTKTDKVVSFVGCHMDVVAAAAEDWDKNPFELSQEGDKVFGRGVTDCLGHVATVAAVLKKLGETKPDINASVIGVFIANEEDSSVPGVGIDEMMKHNELNHLKNGPLFWVDSANFGPTLATAGMTAWEMTVTGKRFHSGIPQNAVNPINLGCKAIEYIQRRFYEDFPMTENEHKYKFEVGCSMKPTQIKTPPGSINQIPRQCIIAGDIRLTPFVSLDVVKSKVESYVEDFNNNMEECKAPGYSSFALKDGTRGKLEFKWTSGSPMKGVAVSLDSPGYKAIHDAISEVRGDCKPFSLTGSLPLIAELKDAGFDVQITGFGRMEAYHAVNEFALLSEYVQGSKIMLHIIAALAK